MLRKLVPISIVVVIIGAGFFFLDELRVIGNRPASEFIEDLDLSMKGIELVNKTKQGEQFILKAQRVTVKPAKEGSKDESETFMLDKVTIDWESNNYGPVNIVSEYGVLDPDENIFSLRENIKITGKNIGDAYGETLVLDLKDGTLHSDKSFNYQDRSIDIASESVTRDKKSGNIYSEGKTRIEIVVDE